MTSGVNLKKFDSRKSFGSIFFVFLLVSIFVSIISLSVLLIDIFAKGLPWLDLQFINSFPSRFPEQAGIKAAFYGTIWVATFTALISFPLGVSAAIYLEEYAPDNFLTKLITINITNLSGIPSIVYGLLGIGILVELLSLGRSILAGAITLSLLILPVIIIVSRESISAVPKSYRFASYALGATRWQTVRHAILPPAFPGILTGTILALSRAIGEAAPMVAIAALVYLTFTPSSPLDRFTVLPIQIYSWTTLPNPSFRGLAAAGIIVLLVLLLTMNSIAIFIRNKYQRRVVE